MIAENYRLREYTFRERGFVYGLLRFEGQCDSAQTCLLQECDGLISLTVPFVRGESEVSCWFLPDYAEDESDWDVAVVPNSLWVEEAETGRIFTLLECEAGGLIVRSNASACGNLVPKLVIVSDSPGDFGKVIAAQSSSPELFRWIGFPAAELRFPYGEGPFDYAPRFKLDSATVGIEGLTCSASLFVTTEIKAGFPSKGDSMSVSPKAFFVTRFDQPTEAFEAIAYHERLKVFFDIVHWDDVSFEALQLTPHDAGALDDSEVQLTFGDVVMRRKAEPELPIGRPPAFLSFGDVGAEGLRRWFLLWAHHERAINRLDFAARSHESITSENLVITLCTVIEEVAAGLCRHEAVVVPWKFEALMRKVVSFVSNAYPMFDSGFDDVVNDVVNTYHAIKHTEEERGGRPREYWMGYCNLYDVAVACRLLLYAWIAAELGCPSDRMMDCFRHDARDSMRERWKEWVVIQDADLLD